MADQAVYQQKEDLLSARVYVNTKPTAAADAEVENLLIFAVKPRREPSNRQLCSKAQISDEKLHSSIESQKTYHQK